MLSYRSHLITFPTLPSYHFFGGLFTLESYNHFITSLSFLHHSSFLCRIITRLSVHCHSTVSLFSYLLSCRSPSLCYQITILQYFLSHPPVFHLSLSLYRPSVNANIPFSPLPASLPPFGHRPTVTLASLHQQHHRQ